MRLSVTLALVAATLFATFLPAPASAAADYCDTLNVERYCDMIPCRPVSECCDIKQGCDCNVDACDAQVPEPYVERRGSGYVVGYRTCEYDPYWGYYYCYDNDVLTVSTDPCDYRDVCPLPEPYVRNNGDGYTVGYQTCEYDPYWGYYYCYDTDLATVSTDVCDYVSQACGPLPDDLCYTYNPSALTNACVTTGWDDRAVSHPSADVTERRTCVIGQEGCVNHAWVTPTTDTTYVPVVTADGYVELTVACDLGVPCRVNL